MAFGDRKLTSFHTKKRKPLRRSSFKSKTPTKANKCTRKPKRKTLEKYKAPKWFTKITAGSHGNTPAQKKYWKVVTDTYRKQDFDKHKGKCVSCPIILDRWEDGQLAHFKAWSVCNSWFKYERKNLALSCAGCNRRDDGVVGHAFGEELKRRWGDDILDWIEKENEVYRGQKLETWLIVDKVAKLRPDLVE